MHRLAAYPATTHACQRGLAVLASVYCDFGAKTRPTFSARPEFKSENTYYSYHVTHNALRALGKDL